MPNIFVSIELDRDFWHTDSLSVLDLRVKRKAMDKFAGRVESAMWWAAEAGADETLPEYILDAIDAAYERMHKMYRLLNDGIEAMDNAIEQYNDLEDNLKFVYEDVLEHVKGVA